MGARLTQRSLVNPGTVAALTHRADHGAANRLAEPDKAFHRWYRFVLSFPPHLVQRYIDEFNVGGNSILLDPFCGTGTALVEAKKLGITSEGLEAHPFTAFSASVKTDWTPNAQELLEHAAGIADEAFSRIEKDGFPDTQVPLVASQRRHPPQALRRLPTDLSALLLKSSISPVPLHKALVLLDIIAQQRDDRYFSHERLAFANSIVHSSSNLRFGPEVGLGRIKPDCPVIGPWLSSVKEMAEDLETVREQSSPPSTVRTGDARRVSEFIRPRSIDAVFTSPPYPNEKDYTRTTRLESVLLGFVSDRSSLRSVKTELLRSNTRGVFKSDDDDVIVADHGEISRLASSIESRRIELQKTSGFERLYPRVAKLYFGGMMRHLQSLRHVLKPGARLAYVVGDQASYLRVMIHTGNILGDLAQKLGYQVDSIDLFRTRTATATREQLREEVLVLRWPGG